MPVNLINRATGSFPYSCPTIETTDPFTWGGVFRDTLQVLADRSSVLMQNPVLYQKTYVNAVAATDNWAQIANSSTNISNCRAGDIIDVSANWAQSATSGPYVAGRISIYNPVTEKYHPSTLNRDLLWRDNYIYYVSEDAVGLSYVVFIDQANYVLGGSNRLAAVQYVIRHYKRGL